MTRRLFIPGFVFSGLLGSPGETEPTVKK